MILLYFKTSKNGLNTLEKAIADKDWETVTEAAHKMAAPSKHFKAEELYKKLKMLENISETNPDENNMAQLFASVKTETTEVIEFLEQFLTRWETKQNR
jgi:HPt (histidine-containing phosphotransfer) domain-containing protein